MTWHQATGLRGISYFTHVMKSLEMTHIKYGISKPADHKSETAGVWGQEGRVIQLQMC